MDGLALASVITSSSITALTLIINAVGRRGDRKHATNLEFQKRVWETKSEALLNTIKLCEAIRAGVANTDIDPALRQAGAWSRFQDVDFTIHTPELVAYASEDVNRPVSQLHEEMQRAENTDAWLYWMHLDEAVAEARRAKEEAIDRGDFHAAADHRDQEVGYRKQLGSASEIDLARVEQLCREVIAAARADLRS